jgi:hypothetical protein
MIGDRYRGALLYAVLVLTAGCGPERPPAARPAGGKSDPDKVRSADVSILFVGNSHTTMHDLPGLIGAMIRHRHPGRSVDTHVVGVGFLEDVGRDPRCREEIETRPWKYVVLQAQKESKTGRYSYSQEEGIAIAKLARARGATVLFYSEWGLRDVPGHGPRIEKVYQAMAAAAGAVVAPVGRAWDRALAARPDLELYAGDGNHQSALGAFLTAAVLYGRLTGDSPAALATFPYAGAGAADRQFLAEVAAQALQEPGPGAGATATAPTR